MASIVVGEYFGFYEKLDQRAKAHQKERSVQFTDRDSCTLQATLRRVPNVLSVLIAESCVHCSYLHIVLHFCPLYYMHRLHYCSFYSV